MPNLRTQAFCFRYPNLYRMISCLRLCFPVVGLFIGKLFVAQAQTAPVSKASVRCGSYSQAGAWHRQTILRCLCRSLGEQWVVDFSRHGSKLFLVVLVDGQGNFYRAERYHSTFDSGRIAHSAFLVNYAAQLARQPFCWPTEVGVATHYELLRVGGGHKKVRRYSLPLFCADAKACSCASALADSQPIRHQEHGQTAD